MGIYWQYACCALGFTAACVVALTLRIEPERAHGQGQKSRPRPCSPSERFWLKPFLAAASAPWTLFDLRELRKPLREGKLNVEWELGQVVAGFDAVVLLQDNV